MEQNQVTNIDPRDFKETDAYVETQVPGARSLEPQEIEPQPEQQQTEEAQRDILDKMSEKGYDVSHYASDQDFIADTEAKYASNASEYAQAGYEQQRYLEDKANAGPDPSLAQQPESNRPDMPQFDPAWANLVEDSGDGRYVVRPEYIGSVDPTIAERVNEYVSFRQQRSNQLIDDPVGTVMEAGLQQEIQNQIDQRVNSALTQNSMRGQAEDFVKQNQEVLYVKDPTSGNLKSNRDGNPDSFRCGARIK